MTETFEELIRKIDNVAIMYKQASETRKPNYDKVIVAQIKLSDLENELQETLIKYWNRCKR